MRSTNLVFICGIERNLADFWVGLTIFVDFSDGKFDTLQKSRLGRIAIAFPDGNISTISF